MPDVGRIAMVADPQGAPFYLMTPTPPADNPDADSDVFSVDGQQHVGWNELSTTDPDARSRFYTDLFGWGSDEFMDMGPMGQYRFLAARRRADRRGHAAPMPGGSRRDWRYYIGVDDIDRAARRSTGRRRRPSAWARRKFPAANISSSAPIPRAPNSRLVGPP